MSLRPHICVLIPVHCTPKVAKLTLGSFLAAADGSYDITVVITIHENYHHYRDDVAEIKAMSPRVKILEVKEIDWGAYDNLDYVRGTMRYSEQHGKTLMALMSAAASKQFSHVLILDHDLSFKRDFVSWGLALQSEVFGYLFRDKSDDNHITMENGRKIAFAPKLSVCHILLTRKAFDFIMTDASMVVPSFESGVVYDTFSKAYLEMKKAGINMTIWPEASFIDIVEHKGSMSFNWGGRTHKENFPQLLAKVEAEYDAMFPNGIDDLLTTIVPFDDVPGKFSTSIEKT